MNKKELVEYISESANLTKAQAEKALNGTLEGIKETLKGGDKVSLVGFGSFSTSRREARTGRNPQTGKSISLPVKTYVKFKVGKALGDGINGK